MWQQLMCSVCVCVCMCAVFVCLYNYVCVLVVRLPVCMCARSQDIPQELYIQLCVVCVHEVKVRIPPEWYIQRSF